MLASEHAGPLCKGHFHEGESHITWPSVQICDIKRLTAMLSHKPDNRVKD